MDFVILEPGFTQGTFTDPATMKVQFGLRKSGSTYLLTVSSSAYDYILYPYPVQVADISVQHTIGDADLNIPHTIINGVRSNTAQWSNYDDAIIDAVPGSLWTLDMDTVMGGPLSTGYQSINFDQYNKYGFTTAVRLANLRL